jgi:Protein of unknown function (DUF3467)
MTEPFAGQPDIEGLPIVYTNLLRTIPSPFEFALDFGYIAPRAKPPTEPPKGQVRVVMSWEYAKLLRDTLQQAIGTRESNVGEIQEPPGLVRIEDNNSEGEEA